MSKRFKPTKDVVIALLSATCIITTGIMTYEMNNTKLAEEKVLKIEQVVKEKDKELKLRDEVLDAKRRELDAKDRTIEEQEIAIGQKEEKITELNKIITQKDSKIKELQNKEFPTQVASAVSRGGARSGTTVELTLTFYGDFAHENGGYAGMDAQGNKLIGGTVASNVYPFGTQFIINGTVFTVRDRGGKNFNSSNRLDVFVPRRKGESDAQYASRISNYGVRKVTAQKM